MGAVLNAANEVAVYAFLDNKIKFLGISKIIKRVMENHKIIKNPDINQILDIDQETRGKTEKMIDIGDY